MTYLCSKQAMELIYYHFLLTNLDNKKYIKRENELIQVIMAFREIYTETDTKHNTKK